jgi:membrane protease YdiL (CAAX protease family)
METETIKLNVLLLSLGGVSLIELGGKHLLMGCDVLDPISVIGLLRGLEGVVLLLVVFFVETNLNAVCLYRRRVVFAIGRGMLWSISLGGGSLCCVFALKYLGLDVTPLFRATLPGDCLRLIRFLGVAGVVSPIAEEILFRGIVYGYFRKWGVCVAVMTSALLFALLHPGGISGLGVPLMGGVFFAVVFEVERDLRVPVVVHIAGNMAIYAGSFLGIL